MVTTDGYAVCPDCKTQIHCGTTGLANLEKNHCVLLPAGVRAVLNSKQCFGLAFEAFWGPIGKVRSHCLIKVGVYCASLMVPMAWACKDLQGWRSPKTF